MFTAAIILMELKRHRGQQRGINGINLSRNPNKKIGNLRIPGEHYIPTASLLDRRTPSDYFCQSLHDMHDKDHTGLAVDNLTLPNIQPTKKSTTKMTATTAIVNPVLITQLKPYDEQEGGRSTFADGDDISRRRLLGKGRLDDVTKNSDGKLGEDGDRLAALHDEIATSKDRRRLVLGQILKLEEKKRRFIRTTRSNQGKLRVARQKRQKLEDLTHSKLDFRLQQVLQLEKEKTDMEEKLDSFEDISIALAMQKEEKHRCLLETIDNAPALYRKESELLEERHQHEVVRYQVLFGLFLTLLAVLLITCFCYYGNKEKPVAGRGGIFY